MQPVSTRAWPRPRTVLRGLALGALVGIPLASSAPAGEGRLQLDYRAYFAGVHGANLGLTVKFDTAAYDSDAAAHDLRATAYAVQARLKTTGLAKVMRWKATAYSRGTLLAGEVVPVRAGYRSRQWTRKRSVELGFDEGTPKLVRMKPRKKSKVPPSRLKGALDPAGAFLAVLSRMDADRVCELRIPVFDGRRLYELVGETDGDGVGRLQAGRYSPFAGPTVDCRVQLERKAGFKRKTGEARRRGDTAMRLRMGRVFDEVPPVPVRFAADTRYGSAVLYLHRGSLTADGLKRELRPRHGRKRPR